jgi:pimeloyl-ACP methyl ester carboxylesterase
MNSQCWENWIEYYGDKGYKCIAPAWPYHDKTVKQLRDEHPNVELGKLTLGTVIENYRKMINSSDKKPILIGHSIGGLVVQALLSEGLGTCGVSIDSAPPAGVTSLKFSFLKSNLPTINPFRGDQPYFMPFKRFQYSFVNTFTEKEQKEAYDRYVVPESRNVARSSTKIKIDFNRKRPPLLMIAGSEDHIIPPSLNKDNFGRYKNSGSITDFKEFEGRAHFIIGQKGWKEVADYAIEWIEKVST